MRAVIQRVNAASVIVNNKEIAKINKGLLIFLGVLKGDSSNQAKYLAQKITQLRIFNDRNRKMNLCAQEVAASVLVVSQFTLTAQLNHGRRPSFDRAEQPATAKRLYLEFIQHLRDSQLKVEQGVFQEYMAVHIENDGPVTFILDTDKEKQV